VKRQPVEKFSGGDGGWQWASVPLEKIKEFEKEASNSRKLRG
jgi:hypothetical protein